MKKYVLISVLVYFFMLFQTNCTKNSNPASNESDDQLGAFINVNLVTMTSQRVDTNQTVLIEGKNISYIGPSNEVDIPDNVNVIDGRGAYLMPGLADMHMHTREDWTSNRWPVSPLKLYLANGVTTIRDFGPAGGDLNYVLNWRDEINNGIRIGPAIYTSGLRPGHPSAGTQDPQSIVFENNAHGFDFLKIYSYLSAHEYFAVMAAAQQLGMYTAGHIPFSVGYDGIQARGMEEIAHIEELDWEFVEFNRDTVLSWEHWLPYVIKCIFQQNDISSGFDLADFQTRYSGRLESIITSLKANSTALSTTMIVDDVIVEKLFSPADFVSRSEIRYLPQDYLNAFNQGFEKHQMQFQGIEELAPFKYDLDKMLLAELHQAGVRLLLSTDAGTASMGIVPGFSIHDELRILLDNGFTPYEAIAAGTVSASKTVEAMTGKNEFGTIEIGKRADLILAAKNPLQNVDNIKNPIGVMAAGKYYSRQNLKDLIDF